MRDCKCKTSIRLRLAALVLVGVLSMMYPRSAYADFDPYSYANWLLNQFGIAMNSLGQMIQAEGNKMLMQDKHDGDVGLKVGGAVNSLTQRGSFTSKTTFCPRVTELQNIQTVDDALASLQSFLQNTMFLTGSNGGTNNAKVGWIAQLCAVGLLPANVPGCQNPPQMTNWNNYAAFLPDVVFATDNMALPSVLQFNGKRLAISGTPQQQDMQALAAIYFCAMRQPDTGAWVASTGQQGGSQANVEQIGIFYDQLQAKGSVSGMSNICFRRVAERIAVPQNAPGGLQAIYQANAAICQQMQDKMPQADFNACTGAAGLSWLRIKRAQACKYQNPQLIVDRAQGESDVPTESSNLDKSIDRCNDFSAMIQNEAGGFAQLMGAPVNIPTPKSETLGAH